MTRTERRLSAQPLSVEAFAPFGWIPVADTDAADSTFTYEFEWADVHVNVISHAPAEVERIDGRLICDRFYRHDTHTQTLLPLDVPSVIAVAPAAIEFTSVVDLDAVRTFLLQPLDGFALARGTWHWGPFPLGDRPVHLWNVQGKRYAEDNRCAEFGARLDTRVEIDV